MRQAGAGAAFRYSAGHAVYVSAAKRNRLQNNGNPFRAYRVSEARPALGDLVCKSRANSGATYDNVRPGMFSHCDIVVAVEPQRVWVIGGNVNQSVARRAVPLTADGRLAPPEYFAVVKIENPSGRSSEVAATPAASLGRTIYAPIDLKIQDRFGRVRPQTGIFCPNGWNPGQAVDLVIYLHGIRNVATIESYWNGRRSRYFALREDLVASGRNAVLVAPLLGQRSQDQIGTLARAGGLDHFCNQVLAALSVQAPVGNIVLACHSGGGLAARTIALANNRLAPVIRECWGFDCTYNSNDHVVWPRWATRRPNGRLFLYYINTPRRGTEPQATKIRALNVPNISVIPSRTNDHNAVPRAYFLERLRNCPFLRNI
jgi:hypothetical protein